MEEKTYIFTRKVVGTEYGIVTATSKEDAIKKIMDNDYDDIMEQNAYFTGLEEDIVELKEN